MLGDMKVYTCQNCRTKSNAALHCVRIEQTQVGAQVVIAETPARKVPETGLKPKRKQTEKQLPLERVEIDAKQEKLLESYLCRCCARGECTAVRR